jgi:chlorobactene glucosyltransferase
MPSLIDILWGLPWVLLTVAAPFVFTSRPRLRDAPAVKAPDGPLVSVVLPARNEAVNIGACVGSLLQSEYTNLEVIIVDDASVDGTGDIARTLAEGDRRVRLVESARLPAGWLGKCWACWQGQRHATGSVLLFTDADTRHGPTLLGHALGALKQTGAALVSAVPRQDMETFWERVVLPHIFMILALRYPDLERVNRSRNPRAAIANGQFIMITRAAYEKAGGHEAIRSEVVEDLRLAQNVVAGGGRLHVAHAEDLMRTRMYRSLGEIMEGWSKNLAAGARSSVASWLRPVLPWILGLLVMAYWVAPAWAFIGGITGFLIPPVFRWGTVTTVAALAFWVGALHRFRVPVVYAIFFPVGGLVAGLLFLRSAIRGERVSWKGRTYSRGDVQGGASSGRNST